VGRRNKSATRNPAISRYLGRAAVTDGTGTSNFFPILS
jgi:hypothetical protein